METNNYILHIKIMVCSRCKYVVKQICEELGYSVLAIEIEQVVIKSRDPAAADKQLKVHLKEQGFQLLDSRQERLVERVKLLLITLIYWNRHIRWPVVLPEYLGMGIQKDFKEIDHLYYSSCGCSIRKYFDLLRFE